MKKSEEKRFIEFLKQMPEESHMRFKYAINKNITLLTQANKDLDKTEKQAREILSKYDKESEEARNKKIMEWGKDDGKGSKSIKPDSENWGKWIKWADKFYKDLDEKYKDDIAKYEKKIEEMKPEYESESEYKPYTVSIDYCPDMPSLS